MRALLLCGIFLAALSTPAFADETWAEDVEVMSADDMDAHRGGFEIGNLNFNFGATVTTLVNGVPALVTNLTWTDVGAFVDQTVGQVGQNISDMTPEQLNALGLGGVSGLGGVVIEDEAGVTALVHNLTDGSLQNIIINNATGRDLAQKIDVTLTLPGFELIQSELNTEIFGMRLNADLNTFLTAPGG
ncbi:MAG: hypothetical protein NT015_18500 [Alphaproteobacteria bacterium]|nr:hypothetical protein [Alphaproteobacteria bacterium]